MKESTESTRESDQEIGFQSWWMEVRQSFSSGKKMDSLRVVCW